jgi:hypothetical protein
VTTSDSQWEEVLWNREEEERDAQVTKKEELVIDDVYVPGNQDVSLKRKGDWVGVERDRRSAFLIIGALKSEGIL